MEKLSHQSIVPCHYSSKCGSQTTVHLIFNPCSFQPEQHFSEKHWTPETGLAANSMHTTHLFKKDQKNPPKLQ